MARASHIETPVLIIGGGPVGLVLAHELNHQAIPCLLIERRHDVSDYPKLDITNGRSMEILRRLGLADDARQHAIAAHHPLSVVWMTRLAQHQLARFDYPSIAAQVEYNRACNDGYATVEPYMRIAQSALEPVLRARLVDCAHAEALYGWELVSFSQDSSGVEAVLRHSHQDESQIIRAQYLIGCDGAGSSVRHALDYALEEVSFYELARASGGVLHNFEAAVRGIWRGTRPFLGQILMIHFRASDASACSVFGDGWHTQFPQGATLIAQNGDDLWTLHVPLRMGDDVEQSSMQVLRDTLGADIACEVLRTTIWTPKLAISQKYGEGRVWLAGDAAHQFVPTGGYGMNTGLGDALGLGWVLGAQINHWGSPQLLSAYQDERRAIAKRNCAAALAHLMVRQKIIEEFDPLIYQDTPAAARARRAYGAFIQNLGNLENEASGIEFGYIYSDSPVICHEETPSASAKWDAYTPTTSPGARPPSVFLADGSNIYDRFGAGFTLIKFRDIDDAPLRDAARVRAMPLTVIAINDSHARRLYERDLVLLRPDNHVGWRGNVMPDNPHAIIARLIGEVFLRVPLAR